MGQVLVIGDQPESREAVAVSLRQAGHRVQCAANGREALDWLGESTPDVIVLDQQMPGMGDVTFLEVIRKYIRWHTLPVVLLTGQKTGPHIDLARSLGVDRILVNGHCDPAELSTFVSTFNPAATPPGRASAPPLGDFAG